MTQTQEPAVPADWQTRAEKTDYRQTPRYDETIAYSRRLADASPLIRYQGFGKSGEGRELPLLIATEGGTFTPEAARKAGKAILLVQACIHPGEPDGKDAGLALLRDIAVTKTRTGLLDKVVLLFIPMYNVDGHERFGPYNRVNQNGPEEMGWRANATNLNLNRDYMKLDAPETRAWLKLWNQWKPDLLIDCHVTDGADYQYDITYIYEHHEHVPKAIVDWHRDAFDGRIFPATEKAGSMLAQYMTFRDNRDTSKGIDAFIMPPRFSTGYTPLRNSPGLTIETHMLKDYRTRVRGTYDLLMYTLEELNKNTDTLLRAVRSSEEEAVGLGRSYDPSRQIPLAVELTEKSVPFLLKGFEAQVDVSDVSGNKRVVFGTKPVEYTAPFYDQTRVTKSAAPPLYYVVPPQWKDVIEILAAHGLRLQRLQAPAEIEVESYRFSEVKWAPWPFEGRLRASYKITAVRERRTFAAGSVLVSLAQPNSRVALHLLEPDAPDSLASWGFFNGIFELKEYAEDYKLEKLARQMLEKDPNLRREFEERLKRDEKFAASPDARLRFFYERSPYWDRQLNLYPVARITTAPVNLRLADF
ncbi:MAG TPA: M14 family metallopeptidase [Pyrinomonadaceae bacterium]|nr:M14 family metallopeptidase [Pyrinomonadaceae bacterium]